MKYKIINETNKLVGYAIQVPQENRVWIELFERGPAYCGRDLSAKEAIDFLIENKWFLCRQRQ